MVPLDPPLLPLNIRGLFHRSHPWALRSRTVHCQRATLVPVVLVQEEKALYILLQTNSNYILYNSARHDPIICQRKNVVVYCLQSTVGELMLRGVKLSFCLVMNIRMKRELLLWT